MPTKKDVALHERLPKPVRIIVGTSMLLIGIAAIPYPGPGWLIVFAALAILAKDFEWADKALKTGRKKYNEWNAWIKRQNWFVRSVTALVTVAVVILTIWLFNGYGLVNEWFNLRQDWLNSPVQYSSSVVWQKINEN